MKTTRRKMGAALASAAIAAGVIDREVLAQTPAPPDLSKLIHDANQRNSDTLAKFEIPIATEPAFQFEP